MLAHHKRGRDAVRYLLFDMRNACGYAVPACCISACIPQQIPALAVRQARTQRGTRSGFGHFRGFDRMCGKLTEEKVPKMAPTTEPEVCGFGVWDFGFRPSRRRRPVRRPARSPASPSALSSSSLLLSSLELSDTKVYEH